MRRERPSRTAASATTSSTARFAATCHPASGTTFPVGATTVSLLGRRQPGERHVGELRRHVVLSQAHDKERDAVRPERGRPRDAPPPLRWRSRAKVHFFNLQVYRHGHKVLSVWPIRARFRLHKQLDVRRARVPLAAGPVHVARLAGVRLAGEAALREAARAEHLRLQRLDAGALGALQTAPRPHGRAASRARSRPEADRTCSGEPEIRLRPPSRRNVVGFTLATACSQPLSSDRGTYTGAKKSSEEDRELHDGPGLHRAQPHRHARGPERSGEVDEERERVEPKRSIPPPPTFIPAASATIVRIVAVSEPAPGGRNRVAEHDPRAPRRREQQAPREPVLEVARDAEAR